MSIVSDKVSKSSTRVQTESHFLATAGQLTTIIEIYNDNTFNQPQFLQSASRLPRAGGDPEKKRKITLPAKAQVNHILIHSDHILAYSHLITSNHLHHAVHAMQLDIHQEADSIYQATIIATGNQLNHLHIHNHLDEQHAKSDIRILKYGRESQKILVETTAHHNAAHTSSNTIARGIMDNKAKGNFTGKIMVAANAEKTQAKLENKNILLSKLAEMNTRPLLEVYNGDIQCSHGATVGYLDEEALFYLRSRGISEPEARTMLIKAFMAPALQHLQGMPDWFAAVEALF